MISKKKTLSKKKKLKNSLIKDLIAIIRIQEHYLDQVEEDIKRFYSQHINLAKLITSDREHYNEQLKQYEENQKIYQKNQKVLEEDVRKSNAMLRMAWVCEDLDIDTKSDFIKFTAKERLEYKNDFELDISTKLLESGKRIDQMTVRKKKRPELKSKEELKNVK